jgi:hypothetical protein
MYNVNHHADKYCNAQPVCPKLTGFVLQLIPPVTSHQEREYKKASRENSPKNQLKGKGFKN